MRSGKNKNGLARTLFLAYPLAKYAAVLLIALNLHRLPARVEWLPGVTAPRQLLMLWPALLMFLGVLADRRADSLRQKDEALRGKPESGTYLLSFLALAVPGLLLLDAAAAGHLYFCWFRGGTRDIRPPAAAVMAAGCVLWIYGRALPAVPFGSVWGVRTEKTVRSPEAWREKQSLYARYFCAAGCLLLAGGMLI